MRTVHSSRLRRLSLAAVYAVVVGLLITMLAYLVRTNYDPLIRLDESTIIEATSFTRNTPGLRPALILWQEISQPLAVHLVLVIPLCAWMWLRLRMTSRAWWAFLTMMVSWALALGVKVLVQRARPVVADPVAQAPGYSFPSGHATNAAVIATTLLLLLWPMLEPRMRRVAIGLAVAWIVLTALDRVLLGVHYPSDVIGGVMLGCGLVLASYVGYLGWTPPLPTRPEDS